ncbi:hypothetical protein [Niabella ginsenosidivorans]|uniref:hypothetical protein n=1 Tax=Niabella ginsenosidivorans TaxID=1176587 RepID=UPI001470BD83|nr:hypothetical protein [Niabella ginsenosidivorans]
MYKTPGRTGNDRHQYLHLEKEASPDFRRNNQPGQIFLPTSPTFMVGKNEFKLRKE